MRILMLSWEYPPLVVGGLGRHVEALAQALAAAEHDVHVVTRGEKDEVVEETIDGVHVHRSVLDPLAIDFTTESLLAWSQAAEHSLIRAALPLVHRRRPDVVHAHDWLVAQSAVTLAGLTGAALAATIHATEAGRHQGWLPRPLNLAIHSVERWLAQSAAAVITCSNSMRSETLSLFELDPTRVHVVPNGVDVERWRARRRRDPGGTNVVYLGRLVHEKGVQTLLDALRPLRANHPDAHLTIAGTGPYEDTLRARARRLRIARSVDWLGYVPDDELAGVLAGADVAVVPSLYEPFGIVALEAAAAGVPVVVTETGGLTDLIADGVAAAAFLPGDASGLARAVHGLWADRDRTHRAVIHATRVIRRDYTWPAAAAHTGEIYRRVAGGRNAR